MLACRSELWRESERERIERRVVLREIDFHRIFPPGSGHYQAVNMLFVGEICNKTYDFGVGI